MCFISILQSRDFGLGSHYFTNTFQVSNQLSAYSSQLPVAVAAWTASGADCNISINPASPNRVYVDDTIDGLGCIYAAGHPYDFFRIAISPVDIGIIEEWSNCAAGVMAHELVGGKNMKKTFALLIFALFLVFGCSCSRTSSEIISESSKPTILPTDSTEITKVNIEVAPLMFSDINLLVSNSDAIIVGYVDKALPVVRIDAVALGLVEGIPELEKNVSSFQIRIDQVLKGDFIQGDTIRVDRNGGLAEGINEVIQDLQYPSEGSTYLMFIKKTDGTEENKYFMYMFLGTSDGFSEIVDGKIVPQKNTSIFKSGTPVNEVITTVSEAIKNS